MPRSGPSGTRGFSRPPPSTPNASSARPGGGSAAAPARDRTMASRRREQLAGAAVGGGMAELRHSSSLDLADPLPGQAEMLPDLVEGARLAPVQPEAQPEDLPLTLVQGDQHLGDLADEQGRGGRFERRDRGVVLDHVSE